MRALTPLMKSDDLSRPTSDKNLVNFGPVTPSFAGAFAPDGLTLGFASHLVLSYSDAENRLRCYCGSRRF